MNGPPSRPRIAVLINNYNNGPHLRVCLESVYAQTRPADEIIAFDDGSDDGGAEFLRSQKDRIRLIEAVHDHTVPGMRNQARAIQASLLATECEWVALLDGDDAFVPVKLERVEQAILAASEDVVLIQSPMVRVWEDGSVAFSYRDAAYHVEDVSAEVGRVGDCDFFYPTSALVLRRAAVRPEVLTQVLASVTQLASDVRLGIASLFEGTTLTIDEPLTLWRARGTSSSAVFTRDRFHLFRQTLRRAKFYNALADERGAPHLHPWLAWRTYARLAVALLPAHMALRVRIVRQRLLSGR